MTVALVTGAAGFVGANLTRALLRDGRQVRALIRPGSDRWRLPVDDPCLSVAEVDLADVVAVRDEVRSSAPSEVFHLAAHGAYPSQRDLPRMVDVNIRATAALLDVALELGGPPVVVAGSSSEYGLKDHAPTEDESAVPNSDYAVTKLASTTLCIHRAMSTGLPVVVLRLASVYGPWEEPSRLVPTLLRSAIRGELPPMADPTTARDFVHIDDVVEAFTRAAARAPQCRGHVLNIGTGVQHTLREIVEVARSCFGIEAEPAWGSYPPRPWDTTTWVTDPTRAAKELGWRAATDLPSGLLATARWLREAPR